MVNLNRLSLVAIILCAVVVSLNPVQQAYACQEYVRHDSVQLAELDKNFKQNENEILKIQAFDELICSNIAGIRHQIYQAAFNSDIEGLRVQALLHALLSKEAINIATCSDRDDLSETQYKYCSQHPALQYMVAGRDYEKRCVSTYFQYKECKRGSQIVVDGLHVNVDSGAQKFGVFELNTDNKLVGTFTDGKVSVPAEIELF